MTLKPWCVVIASKCSLCGTEWRLISKNVQSMWWDKKNKLLPCQAKPNRPLCLFKSSFFYVCYLSSSQMKLKWSWTYFWCVIWKYHLKSVLLWLKGKEEMAQIHYVHQIIQTQVSWFMLFFSTTVLYHACLNVNPCFFFSKYFFYFKIYFWLIA